AFQTGTRVWKLKNKGVQEEVVLVALLHSTIWFSVNLVSIFFALITIVKSQLSSHCCVCTQALCVHEFNLMDHAFSFETAGLRDA
uniref:Uncharacterized protein n=1 Tax=Aegilops tauschii subsp. strangulata TaxID=200361 RepID=A0A453Q1K5_AEGTS